MKKRWIALSVLVVVVAGIVWTARSASMVSDEAAPQASTADRDAFAGIDSAAPRPPEAISESFGGNGGDGGGMNGGDGGTGAMVDLAQAPNVLPPLPEGVPGSDKVIKNINLRIEIDKGEFQSRFSRASTVAEQFQGFVSGSQISESEDGELKSGLLTIRVPADRFEQAVARLKELGEVRGEDRSGQDVSREFVDLEARLRHAQTEEAFYLKLMGEAKSVGDMIQVQSQLSNVQLRIEEIQGRLQYLRDQTSYSTITVNLFEPGAAPIGEPKPLAEAWREAVDGFQSVIAGAVVGLGWVAPFALLGLIGLGVWRVSRRAKAKPAPEAAV